MADLARMLGVLGAKQARHVQIGNLWHDSSKVEHVLQHYCKQIFILTGSNEFPYQFFGSGLAVRFGKKHFLFCTGHQISQFNPDRVAIYVKSKNSTITASSLFVPNVTKENTDTDWIDVRMLEYKVENYNISNLTSEFFPAEDKRIWPVEDRGHFLVFGYPSKRQSIDYETPHIQAHIVEVSATYDGPSNSPFVHRLKMDRKEKFDADGMSGGAVFYIGGPAGTYFAGLAGMIIRGSATSDFIHIIEAEFLRRAVKES